MESGLADYFRLIEEGLKNQKPFKASPFYRPEGDTLYFYAVDEPSYAERLNPILTLFLAESDNRLVGFKIKGISRILKAMERLGIDHFSMTEKGIKLSIFIEFALVVPPEDPELLEYEGDFSQYRDVIVDRESLQLV